MTRAAMMTGGMLAVAGLAIGVGVLGSQGPRPRHVFFKEPRTVDGLTATNFGSAIAVGDVTGDGLPDVAFGNDDTTIGEVFDRSGVVFVASGPFDRRMLRLRAPKNVYDWGTRVAIGEMNGTPPADLIASTSTTQASNYIVIDFGPVKNEERTKWRLQGGSGEIVQDLTVADITGDGQDDLVKSSIFNNRVEVYAGPITPGHPPDGPSVSSIATPFVANNLECADLDSDGFGDVLSGHLGANTGGLSSAGEARVFFGPDLSRMLLLTEPQPEIGAWFGSDVDIGDFDGDGVLDLAVSAEKADFPGFPPNQDVGELFVFLGPDYQQVLSFTSANPQSKILWGDSIAALDVDGDGVDDLAIGAPRGPNTGSLPFGQVEVYGMPSFQLLTALASKLPPEYPEGTYQVFYGSELVSEDVDQDGRDDLVVGAPNATILPEGFLDRGISHGYLSGGAPVAAALLQATRDAGRAGAGERPR